jgi:hypothetical protein
MAATLAQPLAVPDEAGLDANGIQNGRWSAEICDCMDDW